MRLYLVQHGDALSKDLDSECPLSAKGRRYVTRLGEELARSTLTVERILHSGKLRAEETAEVIHAALGERQSLESLAGLGPNDSVKALMQIVENWREDAVVVGHLPSMSKLVGALVAGNEEACVVAFEPGSMRSARRRSGPRTGAGTRRSRSVHVATPYFG